MGNTKPTDWKIEKLDHLITEIIDYRGKTPKKLGGEWSDSGIIALSAMNIKNGRLVNLEKAKFVDEDLYQKWMKSEVIKNDILLTSEAPLGESYLIPDSRRICLSQRLFCIRANPKHIIPSFLFYYFSTHICLQELNLRATGTTVLGIRQPDLRDLPIPLPPLQTQRKIAAILSTYDDLIENNTRRIKILEDMAQTLYREWFVHFRFPGHENIPMVESELGPIPQGWNVKHLANMCEVIMGQSPKSEYYNYIGEGLPFHQGVTNFGPRFPVDRVYCMLMKRIAEDGDILFSVRAPVGRINIANKRIVIGRGISAIRSKYRNQSFILQQLKHLFKNEDIMGSGTIFKAITKADLLEIKLLEPSYAIVDRYVDLEKPISSKIANLTSKNEYLQEARDLILPKLISGEIDVSNLDIDTQILQDESSES